MTMIQIKNRYTNAVIFECEAPDGLESGLHMRHALEQAVKVGSNLSYSNLSGSDLRYSDLRGSDLRGSDLSYSNLSYSNLSGSDLSYSNLSGSDLSYSNLSGSDLSYSNLSGSDLRGSDGKQLPRATPEQSIENLDRVRAIILDDQSRLAMSHWHGNSDWKNRTCAEEAVCGTTHCLAGWLQVCTTEPTLREIYSELAGILCAPVAAKMFYRDAGEVLDWLDKRKYVDEVLPRNTRTESSPNGEQKTTAE